MSEQASGTHGPFRDDAIKRQDKDEAREYGSRLEVEYLGIAQSYRLEDEPGEGAEVFSLIRRSTLEGDPYLDTFFDTGDEFQQGDEP